MATDAAVRREGGVVLYKAELIGRRSWRAFEEVECATSEWADWHNRQPLHSAYHYLSPAAHEAGYCAKPEAGPAPSPATDEVSA